MVVASPLLLLLFLSDGPTNLGGRNKLVSLRENSRGAGGTDGSGARLQFSLRFPPNSAPHSLGAAGLAAGRLLVQSDESRVQLGTLDVSVMN